MVENLRDSFNAYQRRALIVAAVASPAVLLGAILDLEQFFQSYLTAFFYWLALPLGSLGIVQIHHLTGGGWGMPVRRLLEGAMRTLPVMAALFLPIVFGMGYLYEWTHDDVVAHDPLLQHKAPYLNVPFFLVRAVLYFALWGGVIRLLTSFSARQDRLGDSFMAHRLRKLAGPGIGIYAVAMSFAAFDWAMSLEPHWFSTIYGVAFIVGQGLATLAFSILASIWLSKREPFSRWISADHFHDLGKLMFAFVMLWAYVNYSQYLIIWSGNIAEETPWYAHRSTHGWQGVAMFLIVFHFAVPFLFLLPARHKRTPKLLGATALVLLFMRLVDLHWWIAPAFHHEGFHLHWLDVALPLAMGGLWFAAFFQQLKGRPLISLQDAQLQGSLEAEPHVTT